MNNYRLTFGPYSIICREGEPSGDLYFLESGKLLICTIAGTEVRAIARISPGEFIGELSFFDGHPRSTHVISLEESQLLQIPKQEIFPHLPTWYLQIGKNLTKKIRLLDQVIHETKLRKSTSEENRPLSLEEQRTIYQLLTH
jgi:CRP/FNR family transcriptional regulator, cyclic AMP receptor protein